MGSSQDPEVELTWKDLPGPGLREDRVWVVPAIGDQVECHPELSHGSGIVTDLYEDLTCASKLGVNTTGISGFCCSWIKRIVK